ncbi:MAG: CPBP family intramembrane metalloprotease [Candidatus Bathyarchaeum sp.]|nr:MAG: CPBP family intramembrane metalloprotease [Candidatus Bathyarchaeum sp.]
MENQSGWKAKIAFFCYLALAGGILLGGIIVAFILLGMGLDYQELTFPIALISLPINEGIILGITLIFAKHKGASLKDLGLKKPKLNILLLVSVAAVFLILLAVTISVIEEFILGPDPMAEDLVQVLLPRNLLQLVAIVGLSLALVGPAEELAFRGFVQRGFENSFGKAGGLLIASILFGLLHGLNSLRAIIPVFVVSLVLGYIWQKTDGNTTTTAWMHGLYDAITISIAYFASV